MWAVLGLLLFSLIALAVFLLLKLNIFSGKKLETEQFKSLWAFLGVALGAVVTLIGTLLTEQHNRRTESQTREAAAREAVEKAKQSALATQAEERLTLDTITKTLELLTVDGKYAEIPQIAGAIATMMELGKTTIALRVLEKLWAANKVDNSTAVWLIERILEEPATPENERNQTDASALLVLNASELVPTQDDPDQYWNNWPRMVFDSWPSHLGADARNAIQIMAIRVLQARKLDYWRSIGDNYPIRLLLLSLKDNEFTDTSAFVLAKLYDRGFLADLGVELSKDDLQSILSISKSATPYPWFVQLVQKFDQWAEAGENGQPAAALPGPAAGTSG